MGQFGFFDADRRLAAIAAKGDPLEMIARVVPFESFRAEIETAVLTPVSEKKSPKPTRSCGDEHHEISAVDATVMAVAPPNDAGVQGIMTQPIEVVSILVAAGNRRYPGHHHFEHLVSDAIRIAPIRHGVRKPPAHTERATLFP